MHTDYLGSVSMTTSATGTVAQTQEFDPWGAVKAGGITSVSYNYTGQRLDGTGLLFYNARYYDPQLARFTSADSIVLGTSHRSLTVDYHENEFNGKQQTKNAQGFWFQMSKQQKQQSISSLGPENTQALNRYSYVRNNPLNYIDPSGHAWVEYKGDITIQMGLYLDWALSLVISSYENTIAELDRMINELDTELNYKDLKFILAALGVGLGAACGPAVTVCSVLFAAVGSYAGLLLGRYAEEYDQYNRDQQVAMLKEIRAVYQGRVHYLRRIRTALRIQMIEAVKQGRDIIHFKIEVGPPSIVKVTIEDTVVSLR